jgi:tryptophan-rich sensory protein
MNKQFLILLFFAIAVCEWVVWVKRNCTRVVRNRAICFSIRKLLGVKTQNR